MKTFEVRGVHFGEGRPKILASVCGTTVEDALEQATAMNGTGIDIVEWRLDWYEDVFDADKLLALSKTLREGVPEKPILATFRTAKEGGEKAVEPEAYAELNIALIKSGNIDMVDVEAFTGEEVVARIIAAAHEAGVYVIASNHDFDKTPEAEEIVRRLRFMQDAGADVAKIALMPTCRADVITLMDATRDMYENYAEVPLITMSMSGMGTCTRLVGEAFGSAGTFGAAKQASAPGQVGWADLEKALDVLHGSL